jgi:hypothetical protein
MAELSPGPVVRPFLDVIRHEQASSTLTGAALEAVQNLLHAWPWAIAPPTAKDAHALTDAVSDVVDAVSQCRFQETSAESDQNVLVLVVHTLSAVVRSPAAQWLSDHSVWQLVESLYALSRAGRYDVRAAAPHLAPPAPPARRIAANAPPSSIRSRTLQFRCALRRPASCTTPSPSSSPTPPCTKTRSLVRAS